MMFLASEVPSKPLSFFTNQPSTRDVSFKSRPSCFYRLFASHWKRTPCYWFSSRGNKIQISPICCWFVG
jgi:hypothetical protein